MNVLLIKNNGSYPKSGVCQFHVSVIGNLILGAYLGFLFLGFENSTGNPQPATRNRQPATGNRQQATGKPATGFLGNLVYDSYFCAGFTGVLFFMRYRVSILIVIMLVMHLTLTVCEAPPARGQLITYKPVDLSFKEFVGKFEEKITEMMEQTGTPGAAVAVVKDGSVHLLKGLGIKKAGTTDSVDINTVFRIASVSKGFTGALGGILEEEGLFSLDDRVIDYIPEFSLSSNKQTRHLTLNHVLSHTTGLPYHAYTNLVESGIDLDEMIRRLRNVKLISREGTLYSYQNVAYGLIEKAVASTCYNDFSNAMQSKIFTPLGMDNASMSHEAIMNEENVAAPHLVTRRGWVPIRISESYYNVASAGGINASIQDMSHWLQAMMGYRPDVISKYVLDRIFEPKIPSYIRRQYFSNWNNINDIRYGLGWRILKYGEDSLAYHGGYVNGYRSEILVNRSENIGVCILVNAPSKLTYEVIPTFLELYDEYRNSAKKTSYKVITLLNENTAPRMN